MISVVSGLPRSGTSLMMQMLAAGGLAPLADGLRPPDEDNPSGYFEYEPVKRSRSDCGWVAQAEGKAVKVIHLLLPALPAGHEYRAIVMRRPIDEVLLSQSVMLQRGQQTPPSLPPEKLASIFEEQLRQAVAAVAVRSNWRLLQIDYHDCLNHPHDSATAAASFLDLPLDLEAMAAAVQPSLYRSRLEGGRNP